MRISFCYLAFVTALSVSWLTGCVDKPSSPNTVKQQSPLQVRPPTRDGYKLIASPPAGLFPCALAVASVASASDDLHTRDTIDLIDRGPSESVAWLDLFDDSVRLLEVFPATVPNRYGSTISVARLLSKTGTEGAGLCLIYQVTMYGDGFADVEGVLCATANDRALAFIAAQAEAPLEEVERPPGRVKVDRRHVDPKYVALDGFRRHVRACILELINDPTTGLASGGARGLRQRLSTSRDTGVRLGADRDR